MSKSKKPLTGESFDKLTDAEKERIFRQLDSLTSEQVKSRFRPLTAKEKREHFKRKSGRPQLGKAGTEIISVTVEKSLLEQANAYAKANGMKRSELVTLGLRLAMQTGARKAG